MFCNVCDTRLRATYKNGIISLLTLIPFAFTLLWNIVVINYGDPSLKLKKVDTSYVLILLMVGVPGLVYNAIRNKYFEVYKTSKYGLVVSALLVVSTIILLLR